MVVLVIDFSSTASGMELVWAVLCSSVVWFIRQNCDFVLDGINQAQGFIRCILAKTDLKVM